MSRYADSVIMTVSSSLEITNSKFSTSELLVTRESGEQSFERWDIGKCCVYFNVYHLCVVMFYIEYHSKSVADSPSFIECWESRWLLK